MPYDDSSFLRREDFDPRIKTRHVCPVCNDTIDADEDVAVLQVVQGCMESDVLETTPILDGEGDFKFEPIFIHFRGCWTDIYADLEKIAEDTDPVRDLQEEIKCNVCQSSIRAWEVMVSVHYGEFTTSRRSPNNRPPEYLFKEFTDMEDPTTELCIPCILNVVSESLAAWEDVSENGECNYCTHNRCWRKETCNCSCHG